MLLPEMFEERKEEMILNIGQFNDVRTNIESYTDKEVISNLIDTIIYLAELTMDSK
jgi:hypothetical protein